MVKTTKNSIIQNTLTHYAPQIILSGIILFGVILRLFVLGKAHFGLDGDEAVSGIAALRLSRGQDFPIFFYGQSYMAPTDSWIAAPFIGLGSGWLKVAPLLWSVLLIWLNYVVTMRFFQSHLAGLLAAALTAAPSLYFLVNSLRVLGSFSLTLVLGNVLFLITYQIVFGTAPTAAELSKAKRLKILRFAPPDTQVWFWLGLVVGFSFYAFWLIGFYYLPVFFFLFLKDKLFFVRSKFVGTIVGFFIGSLPFWMWNGLNNWGTFRYFFEPKPGTKPPASDILSFFFNTGLPLVVGSQNYWFSMSRWLGLALLVLNGLILAGWLFGRGRGIAGWVALSLTYARPVDMLLLFFLLSPLVYLLSGVGNNAFALSGVDTTGRYLLPLMAVAPILVGGGIASAIRWVIKNSAKIIENKVPAYKSIGLGLGVIAVLVIGFCNLYPYRQADFVATFQSSYFTVLRPPVDNQAIVNYLKNQEIEYYVCNHWVGNRLMLEAREEIKCVDYYDVVVQKGPERFPEHTAKLLESGRPVGYVLVNISGGITPLENRLKELNVTYRREDFKPYSVIIPTSRPVAPSEVANQLTYPY